MSIHELHNWTLGLLVFGSACNTFAITMLVLRRKK